MGGRVDYPPPFTSAQWKELERQAMIYKYMTECIPVPHHLLLPLSSSTRNFATAGGGGGLIYYDNNNNLRYNNNNNNSNTGEPGRCKRTDGKKWRCSRDVAPNQKYCERHMHRGRPRPRSRKPVEQKNKIKATTHHHPNGPNPTHLTITTNYTNREMGWNMQEKMLAAIDGVVEQQCPHLMDNSKNIALTPQPHPHPQGSVYDSNASSLFQHEALNLFGDGDVQRSYDYDYCQLFLNPFEEQPQIDHPPRGFIDAWSIEQPPVVSSSLPGNISPCSLTLSMAMVAADDHYDEMGNKINQECSCSCDCCAKEAADIKATKYSSCWVPFARGGPLAEVLHTAPTATPLYPYPAKNGGDSISISTPASTVSSPSGVLHRALFSQSDTSVCNSPTLPCTR